MINPLDNDCYSELYGNMMSDIKDEFFSRSNKDVFDLSYPFIPIINKNSVISVVGLETRGWVGSLGKAFNLGHTNEQISESSLKAYESVDGRGKSDPSKFGQFKLKVNDVNIVQWHNFFPFDYKNKSLSKNKILYKLIANRMVGKLAMEINYTNPKVIIFSGSYYGLFDSLADLLTKKRERIKDGKYFHELWDHERLIIRIPHPSSRIVNRDAIISAGIDSARVFLNDINVEGV